MRPSVDKLSNIKSFQEEIARPQRDGSTSNAPLLVAIEPTTRCNFACVHCSRATSNEPPTDMSAELFQAVVPASQFALEVYLFGDGEVLLNVPQHLAMVSRIYQQNPGCTLGFSTNGRLLTQDVYQQYSSAGVQYIQVSVDAATKELYETMRRGGNFDGLLRNLEGVAAWRRRFSVSQPDLILATVISQQNYRELPELAKFAEKYGFSRWYVNAEAPENPGRDLLCLTSEHRSELARIKARIADTFGSSFSVRFDSAIGLPGEATERWTEQELPIFCAAPWQQFEVKANGDVQVCPYFQRPICSMLGRSFEDVWNGPEFRQVRRSFTIRADIPACCLNCNLDMRKQFLPDSPALVGIQGVNVSNWVCRGATRFKKFISRRLAGAMKALCGSLGSRSGR
jgi:MoaA/NifB/PqqE/SkfB family radical SAM enzyme